LKKILTCLQPEQTEAGNRNKITSESDRFKEGFRLSTLSFGRYGALGRREFVPLYYAAKTRMQFDRSKSLQELEGHDWGDPTFDSHLVTECHRLHRVPLCDFTLEDLRITIGQNIGLEYLVPLAIEKLRENPLAEGVCYPGDLLSNVLRADAAFWREHPDLHNQLIPITERALSIASAEEDICKEVVLESVSTAYKEFKRQSRTKA
jgi:hypothetical protein